MGSVDWQNIRSFFSSLSFCVTAWAYSLWKRQRCWCTIPMVDPEICVFTSFQRENSQEVFLKTSSIFMVSLGWCWIIAAEGSGFPQAEKTHYIIAESLWGVWGVCLVSTEIFTDSVSHSRGQCPGGFLESIKFAFAIVVLKVWPQRDGTYSLEPKCGVSQLLRNMAPVRGSWGWQFLFQGPQDTQYCLTLNFFWARN